MTTSDPLVTVNDVLAAGGCSWGARRFLRRHGLDHRQFFTGGGLPASVLEATGDAMAKRVAEVARERGE